jgi:hypothetical protein
MLLWFTAWLLVTQRLVIYDWLSMGLVYWILLLSEGILHLLGTPSHREISCLLIHLRYILITYHYIAVRKEMRMYGFYTLGILFPLV